VKSQQGRPSLVCPPLGIAHGKPGDLANESAKLLGWLAAVHVFRRAPRSGLLVMRASRRQLSVFEKVLPQDGWETQSRLRAVFLAKVDMDGVLDD